MPGLDLARGVAILLVLFDHGFAADQTPYHAHPSHALLAFDYLARLGHYGVHLFFILSGFLITGILLDSRTQPDYFRNFYARRVLRIAPAYLLMVAVLFLTHSITARYLAVCLLCLCNMPGLLGASSQYPAFWSLSVEEQFYFVWPFVIRKLSRRTSPSSALPSSSSPPSSASPFSTARPSSMTSASRPGPSPTSSQPAPSSPSPLDYRTSARRLHRAIAPLLLLGAGLFLLQHLLPNPSSPTLANLLHATHVEPWLFGFSGFVLLTFLHPGLASHVALPPPHIPRENQLRPLSLSPVPLHPHRRPLAHRLFRHRQPFP